jgi:RNA polymerase sigma-70 factor (ECF subfamily)
MPGTATRPANGKMKIQTQKWDDPDIRLMLRVRDDDQVAFSELLDRYRTRIFGHFFRLFNNRQDAEDLAQEVFLRLYRSRKRYQPRARFATWLFHITQNVARNAIRSRRRRPCVRLETLAGAYEGPLLESLLFDRGEEPSRPVERAEVADRVRAAVSTLAGRQRTAVVLHQLEDRTYNEVAAEMAMSPEAAKSLLYRARNQLRECLSGFMESERGV